MKYLYDMSTLSIVDSDQSPSKKVRLPASDEWSRPALQLQEIAHQEQEPRRIPPELAAADLDAFLSGMD
jgi:hypothetical protein